MIQIKDGDGLCVTDDPRPVFRLFKNAAASTRKVELELHELTWSESGAEPGYLVWRSGQEDFRPTIQYDGPRLSPHSAYRVTLTVGDGEAPVYREYADFETGFMGTPWSANWIEPIQEEAVTEPQLPFFRLFTPEPSFCGQHHNLRPVQELVKDFHIERMPVRARMYASAHGIYQAGVNKEPVSGDYLAPESSSYQSQLYYQTYDIKDLLRTGENRLTLELADGWWIGRIGLSGDSCQYGNRLGCIVSLMLEYADGTRQFIGSDESFRGRQSQVEYADLFMGQKTNLNRVPGEWLPCEEVDAPKDLLVAQPHAPVRDIEVLEGKLFTTPSGELVADFGRCIAGVPDLEIVAPAGTEVTLDFSEVLDADGNFLRNIIGRNKDQQDRFVCGDGPGHFLPRHTYHGFQYMKIEGVEANALLSIRAREIGSEIRNRGSFRCSDARLNQLQQNIRRSTRANLLSVPTDCPQREKAGWTGDMLVFASTGCFNFHLQDFLVSWLSNMRLEQFPDGKIPVVVPNYPAQSRMQEEMGGGCASGWSDACVHIPWILYQNYGDPHILLENLEMMRRWIDYSVALCSSEPEDLASRSRPEQDANAYLFNTGFQFGDWFIPSYMKGEGNPFAASAATKDVVATILHYITLEKYASAVEALLDQSRIEAAQWQQRALEARERMANIADAFLNTWTDADGKIQGDLQGMYVLALAAGFADEKLTPKFSHHLIRLIRENGNCLDTGFLSTPHLLSALHDAGHADVARMLLFQTKSPSWLYMIEKGANSIWENWEAIRPDGTVTKSSFNHYALGSVGDYLYRYIAGIRLVEPAYRSVEFSPDLDIGLYSGSDRDTEWGLDWAEASVESHWGEIALRWEIRNSGCRVDFRVPVGVSAVFRCGSATCEIPPGEQHIHLKRAGAPATWIIDSTSKTEMETQA